jgi:hypothetical protein
MWTVLAIILAIVDSCCFAAAAVVQQRAVRQTVRHTAAEAGTDAAHPDHHRLSFKGLLSLIRKPGWLAGVALMGLGGGLHIVALSLAPISVIQPIGVLGVPIAILLAAKLDHHRPEKAAVIPILVCVLSIGGFVWLAASHVGGEQPIALTGLLIAEGVLLAVAAIAIVVTRFVHGWRRCLINAVAGAMSVGMVAALMRAIAQHLQAGNPVFDTATLGMAGLAVLNMAVGGWLVQQAYASGRAAVVLACLTVVDPMVAVLIGLVLLGEGADLSVLTLSGMTVCGLAAAAGVVALARSHPGVGPAPAPARISTVRDQLTGVR